MSPGPNLVAFTGPVLEMLLGFSSVGWASSEE
jgi:hypothetical protein